MEYQGIYGNPRITKALHRLSDPDYHVCEKTVGRYMAEMGLRAVPKEPYVITTDSNHSLPIYLNLLDRAFNPKIPDRVWVTDITYVWTSEGWLYLATVMDLFSRKIIGWNMDKTLTKELCLVALNRALNARHPSDQLIHHSDRSSQYASNEYIARLEEHYIQISMSRKGNCYDNACIESFHATIKKERIYRRRYKTREEATMDILKFIGFYNERRMHSTLDYRSPNEIESFINVFCKLSLKHPIKQLYLEERVVLAREAGLVLFNYWRFGTEDHPAEAPCQVAIIPANGHNGNEAQIVHC